MSEVTDKPNYQNAKRFGLIVIAIFFGGFGLWALTAPLESAAVAPGRIIVSKPSPNHSTFRRWDCEANLRA